MDDEEDLSLDALIGEEVRHIRLAENLSQTDLGARVGLTQSQIQNYETGRAGLSVRRLVAIADALGVDPAHFLRVRRGAVAGILSAATALSAVGAFSDSDLRLAAKIALIRNDASRRDIISSIERLVETTTRAESGMSVAGVTQAPN